LINQATWAPLVVQSSQSDGKCVLMLTSTPVTSLHSPTTAPQSNRRWFTLRLLDVPTLSGPTSGSTLMEELQECVRQATRWTIGAAEVFHYFFVKLLKGNYFAPGLVYFWWFVYYYGIVLCASGLVQISTSIVLVVSFWVPSVAVDECRPFGSWIDLPEDFPFQWTLDVLASEEHAQKTLLFVCLASLPKRLVRMSTHLHVHESRGSRPWSKFQLLNVESQTVLSAALLTDTLSSITQSSIDRTVARDSVYICFRMGINDRNILARMSLSLK